MISCIVCYRSLQLLENLRQNVEKTIGQEYEIIAIDNINNTYSIFSAYNEGVRRAKGDIVCFVHEDVLFRSEKWGITISNHFQDETIGIIGFAGAHYLPSKPFSWWESCVVAMNYVEQGKERKIWHVNNSTIVDVAVCDGFCLFMRKSIFEKIQFDEQSYKGFHFYDMDICMQALQSGYRVCVCKDVLTEHFSAGKTNIQWIENRAIFYDKWAQSLPINRGLSQEEIGNIMVKTIATMSRYNKIVFSKAYRIGLYILHPRLLWKRLRQGKHFDITDVM